MLQSSKRNCLQNKCYSLQKETACRTNAGGNTSLHKENITIKKSRYLMAYRRKPTEKVQGVSIVFVRKPPT